jgi:hypothetical protein
LPAVSPVLSFKGHPRASERAAGLTEFEIYQRVPFFRNANSALNDIQRHLSNNDVGNPEKNANFIPILEMVKNFRPVHRLGKHNFLSVCRLGSLLSFYQLQNFTPTTTLPLVLNHPRVSRVLADGDPKATISKGFIRTYIEACFTWLQHKKDQEDPSMPAKVQRGDLDRVTAAYKAHRPHLEQHFPRQWIDTLEAEIKSVVAPIVDIDVRAIGYHVDALLGTDRSVFSIVGPHTGAFGNIHLVLNPVIQWHPNFYVLPNAATFYHSKNYQKNRPWVDARSWEEGGKKDFLESKLHPVAPNTATMQALDLVARTAAALKKNPMHVTHEDVKQWWLGQDSHCVFEGHLPSQVPVSYIDHVIMSQDIWAGLTPDEQTLVSSLFPTYKITKSKSEDDTRRRSVDLSMAPRDEELLGFCFVMSPKEREELLVPLQVAANQGVARLDFEAEGTDFALCLTGEGILPPISLPSSSHLPSSSFLFIPLHSSSFLFLSLVFASFLYPLSCPSSIPLTNLLQENQ